MIQKVVLFVGHLVVWTVLGLSVLSLAWGALGNWFVNLIAALAAVLILSYCLGDAVLTRRVGTRSMLLLTVAAAAVLVVLVHPHFHWTDARQLEVEVSVRDALTGSPIEGASVQLIRQGPHNGAEALALMTDAHGKARLQHVCNVLGQANMIGRHEVVDLSDWILRADAIRYHRAQVKLQTYPLDEPRPEPAVSLVVQLSPTP